MSEPTKRLRAPRVNLTESARSEKAAVYMADGFFERDESETYVKAPEFDICRVSGLGRPEARSRKRQGFCFAKLLKPLQFSVRLLR